MTFTKEQLIARAETVLSNARTAADFHDSKPYHLMDIRLAEIALASLEAEPVGEVVLGEYDDCGCHPDARVVCIAADGQADWENFKDGTRLYTAPPAPVSVPDEMDLLTCHLDGVTETYAEGWNACRATMLQGAEPVRTANKFPVNTPCKEAPEYIWLQTAGVWPENGEFSELTWCSENQHADDTLYVRADVMTGNSPQILEGYVLVPSEPTSTQWAAGMQAFNSGMDKVTRVYKAMLAAAPQQEVK